MLFLTAMERAVENKCETVRLKTASDGPGDH